MFKKLFQPAEPFPFNRKSAVKYTKEMAEGIKLWVKIDVFVFGFATTFYAIYNLELKWLGVIILFAIGCPLVMIVGFLIGCLHYLTAKEVCKITKKQLSI